MIFERLIVERYGHFERLDLDLSAGGHGAGMALIHGHNESGKSTLLQAIRDLFFGIDERTPYAYAFDYRAIHLRALLRDSAGQHLAIERRKKRKNPLTGTLTSQAGVVDLDAERFARYFGGVTGALYNALFGFSLEDLQRGGEILGAAGLAEILGGSALGGSGEQIRIVLQGLHREADELYKRHGKLPAINRVLGQLREVQTAQRDATLQLSHYQGLTERLAQIRGDVDDVDRRLVALRSRRERAQVLGALSEELAERERLRRRIEVLAAATTTDASTTTTTSTTTSTPTLCEADARAIVDNLGALDRRAPERARLRAEVVRLEGRAAALVVDPAILGEEAAIERLVKRSDHLVALRAEVPRERAALTADAARLTADLAAIGDDGGVALAGDGAPAALRDQLRRLCERWQRANELAAQAERLDRQRAADIEAARAILGRDSDDADDRTTNHLAHELEELSERRAQVERQGTELLRLEVEAQASLAACGIRRPPAEIAAIELPARAAVDAAVLERARLDERGRRLAEEVARFAADAGAEVGAADVSLGTGSSAAAGGPGEGPGTGASVGRGDVPRDMSQETGTKDGPAEGSRSASVEDVPKDMSPGPEAKQGAKSRKASPRRGRKSKTASEAEATAAVGSAVASTSASTSAPTSTSTTSTSSTSTSSSGTPAPTGVRTAPSANLSPGTAPPATLEEALLALTGARERRSGALAALRDAWLGGARRLGDLERYALLRGVEVAIDDADAAADHLRALSITHARRSAGAGQHDLEDRRRAIACAQDDLAAAEDRWRGAWEALWRPIGAAPPVIDALAWERALVTAQDAWLRANELRGRLDGARLPLAEYEARLRQHLGQPHAAWPLLARLLRERERDAQTRRGRRESTRERLSALEAAREHDAAPLAEARRAAAELRREVDAILAPLGLGGDAIDPPTALLRLDRRAELGARGRALGERRDALARREAALGEVIQEARALAERLGLTSDARPIDELAHGLQARLTLTRGNAVARTHALEALAAAKSQEDAALAEAAAIHERLTPIRGRLGLTSDEALAAAAERALAEAELSAREAQIVARLDRQLGEGEARRALEAELAQADPAALRAEVVRLDHELHALGRRRTELAELKGKLDQEIESLGGDRAARLGAEAESLLADLGDQVERYLLVHLAEKILDTVTDRHAREGQPAILAHTSALLARITDGRHVRVSADRQASTLVVHDALGHARTPKEMSTGTREQLFLALRLAYVVDYCDRAEPLPVIIDDVLVNFDRGRARSTIEALLEVSRSAQVLLFTCHDHIVELVREVAPRVPIFSLPDVDARAAAVDAVSLRVDPAGGELAGRILRAPSEAQGPPRQAIDVPGPAEAQ